MKKNTVVIKICIINVFKNVFILYRVFNFSVYCGIVIRVESFCLKREKHVFSRNFEFLSLGNFADGSGRFLMGEGLRGEKESSDPVDVHIYKSKSIFTIIRNFFLTIFWHQTITLLTCSNFFCTYLLVL